MLKTLFTISAIFLSIVGFGQQFKTDVKPFTRLVVSPRINVIIEKGTVESVRVVYENITEDKINVNVSGKTLRIYLDEARKKEKSIQTGGMYEGATITAYVTYRELEGIEIRGNQELVCVGPIQADVFRLRAYGQNDIHLSSLKSDFFQVKLYGQNDLQIGQGRTLEQKYVLYGENKIDSKGLRSDYITTSIFGEGSLRVNSAEEVRINAVGEPNIFVDGGAHVSKRFVIGKANIYENVNRQSSIGN